MTSERGESINFVREKKIYQGKKYLDVDIMIYSTEQERRLPKCKRRQLSTPHQRDLNDRNSKRYFVWLVNSNFGENDYIFDLTYSVKPESREAAEKELTNCLKRLRRLYDKHGAVFKYVAVTEGGKEKPGGSISRIHHHLIISGGVPRKEIKKTWSMGRSKCDECEVLPGENGLEPRALYMVKSRRQDEEMWKKRWRCSQNLKKPVESRNDRKYTHKRVNHIVELYNSGAVREYIEKHYSGYEMNDILVRRNKVTSWPEIYIRLVRVKNTN